MTALLEVQGLSRSFGAVQALRDASLSVQRGSITALIGPNGSGKTTLFNVVTGYLKADAGRVRFDGHDVTGAKPAHLYRRGLCRTFQQARVFSELTVLENLVVAGEFPLFRRRIGRADRTKAGALLDEFSLTRVADLYAAELSYGQRKLLEFAAVLMSEPKLVLLDEPTAGVNPLLIEHDMGFIAELCDPVIVMAEGQVLTEGSFDAVRNDHRVREAYLGRRAA